LSILSTHVDTSFSALIVDFEGENIGLRFGHGNVSCNCL